MRVFVNRAQFTALHLLEEEVGVLAATEAAREMLWVEGVARVLGMTVEALKTKAGGWPPRCVYVDIDETVTEPRWEP